MPRKFKWEEGIAPHIKEWLNSDPELPGLLNNDMDNTKDGLETFNALHARVASKFLLKTGGNNTCRNKRWFNRSCETLRREVKKL